MGKKQQGKDEAPNPNSVVNREVFQRLSFLYQASAYLQGLDGAGPLPSKEIPKTQSGKQARKRRKVNLGDLGSSYVRNMRAIGNKTVVRIDPNVKRTLCKGCDMVLIPGTTVSVRLKGHKVTHTCLECRTSRVIPAPPVAPTPLPNIAPLSNAPAPTASTSLQGTLEALEEPAPIPSKAQRPGSRKKRRPPAPRPLPLFARKDAGHVVFRGNEILTE